MSFDWMLAAQIVALLGAMQAICWLLAKGLGMRLEGKAVALGWALPLLLMFPWLDETRLMVPADPMQGQIPGAPAVPVASHRHDILNDAIHCLLPWELEVRHALRDGRLPLWSDHLEGGSSPWVNPQAQPLSPVAMLTRAIPIQHHLLAALALKILLAFQGAWLLSRRVGLSRFSSRIAAGGFALSGGLIAWAMFPHSTVAAWVPWLATAVIGLFRGGGPRMLAMAALLTGILLLSGQPETAAAGGLFAAVAGLSLRRRGQLGRGFVKAAAAAGLGFCLAAPQLLPFALHLPHSVRAHEVLDLELPPHLMRAGHPLSWFLPGFGKYMMAPVSPRAYGLPFEGEFRGPFNWVESECGYAGLLAFAGSMAALLGCRRRRLWPFLGFGIASLLLAAQLIPLVHLIHATHFLKSIAWSRFLLVGCLALAIAGGMGIDLLLARRQRILRPAAVAGLAGLAIAAGLSLAAHADGYTVALWSLIFLSVAALFAAGKWPAARRCGQAGLALVLLLDLVPWGRSFLPASDPGLFYPRTDFIAQIAEETAAAGGPWRAVGEAQVIFPSLLAVYGIDELRPHNPLTPVQFLRTLEAAFGFAPSMLNYFPTFSGIDHPLLDFLGVRAVVSTRGASPAPGLERIDDGRFGPFKLYRNNEALPRFFLPTGAEPIAEAEVASFIEAMQDPRRVAVFDPRAAAWTGEKEAAVTSVETRWPGRISLEVTGRGDRLLASSLRQPEGWRAAGMEKLLVNGAYLGVHLPAGASRVELSFRPRGFREGMWLGALAAAALAALLWKSRAPHGRSHGSGHLS